MEYAGLIREDLFHQLRILHRKLDKTRGYKDKLEHLESDIKKTMRLLEDQMGFIEKSRMEALGQLVSGISHEFNQPLFIIRGNSQLMLSNLDDKKYLEDNLMKIIDQVDHMASIIHALYLFSRQDEPKLQYVNINDIITESLELFVKQFEAQNIHVKPDLAQNLPDIPGDRNNLKIALVNIISNARDAIDCMMRMDGGEIFIQSSLRGDFVNITISDTGKGIPPESREYVFNPFYTTKAPDKGMGLGLAVVYRIIATHKGSIEAESIEGQGTSFVIHLPISDVI
ncbi:MAG: HAMP domain-containing sensor histidine kinase [Candidatus Omnitrophota bacterium]